jgi:hypothetical protein
LVRRRAGPADAVTRYAAYAAVSEPIRPPSSRSNSTSVVPSSDASDTTPASASGFAVGLIPQRQSSHRQYWAQNSAVQTFPQSGGWHGVPDTSSSTKSTVSPTRNPGSPRKRTERPSTLRATGTQVAVRLFQSERSCVSSATSNVWACRAAVPGAWTRVPAGSTGSVPLSTSTRMKPCAATRGRGS